MILTWLEIALLITPVVVLIFLYFHDLNKFFKKRGINYVDPVVIFGNMFKISFGKRHSNDLIREIHEKFPHDKYAGFFNFTKPMILLKDLDLIKQVFVKDFDHFTDHLEFTDETVEPLMGKMLFALQGEKWRIMRNTLSPAFTGSKMRGMLPFIAECSDIFAEYVNHELDSDESKERGYVEYEMKDFTSRYANDVIASCAFGIKIDSINDKQNYFYTLIKSIVDLSFFAMLKLYIFFMCPVISKVFRLELVKKESSNYFRHLIMNNMAMREEKHIVRNDMIHLLMLAKKGSLHGDIVKQFGDENIDQDKNLDNKPKKTEWTDDELIAQAFVFIFAGFDTVSTALSFLMHELAMNPDVQKKLQNEIDEYFINHKDIDYNDLNKMKYMDMVVTELLRLWPPAPFIDRKCTKTYELPPQNDSNKTHTMRAGEGLWVPIHHIHMNPDIYEDPDKFDPERFSDENKSGLHPFAYLPFGGGSRVCIGSRFALMEIKVFVLNLLRHYDVIPTQKTCYPIKLKPDFFDLIAESGLWVGFKRRN